MPFPDFCLFSQLRTLNCFGIYFDFLIIFNFYSFVKKQYLNRYMTTIKPGKLLLNFLEFQELIGKGYYI